MPDTLPLRARAADPPAVTPGPAPLLLSAARVAEQFDIGLRTVRTWDAAGRLPKPVRIGVTVRWCAAELAAWTAAGCPDRAEWEARKAASRK